MQDKVLTEENEYESYATLVGTTDESVYNTETFKWRILKIDEINDTLTIVADGVTGQSLTLSRTWRI